MKLDKQIPDDLIQPRLEEPTTVIYDPSILMRVDGPLVPRPQGGIIKWLLSLFGKK